jgi:hypothetical protein
MREIPSLVAALFGFALVARSAAIAGPTAEHNSVQAGWCLAAFTRAEPDGLEPWRHRPLTTWLPRTGDPPKPNHPLFGGSPPASAKCSYSLLPRVWLGASACRFQLLQFVRSWFDEFNQCV